MSDKEMECLRAFMENDNESPYYRAKIFLLKMVNDKSVETLFGLHQGYDFEVVFNHIRLLLEIPSCKETLKWLIRKCCRNSEVQPHSLEPFIKMCPELVIDVLKADDFFCLMKNWNQVNNQQEKYLMWQDCLKGKLPIKFSCEKCQNFELVCENDPSIPWDAKKCCKDIEWEK